MRIMVVSHPPLRGELGAGQTALALAEGLREVGHDAIAWSAADEVRALRGGALHAARAEALVNVVRQLGPFDVVDAPAADLVELAKGPWIRVARSVQPVLEYLEIENRAALRNRPLAPSTWRSLLEARSARRRTIRGLLTADRVLALGSLERQMLLQRLPALAERLSTYFAAPPSTDREALRGVRNRRATRRADDVPHRFLWIGRWTAHKGIRRLLDWIDTARLENSGSLVTIAGGGEIRDRRLLDLVGRGVVEIVPRYSRADLPEVLARHDAGLFTSEVEGWGLGLQEMLESGLPVYAVEAGAVPDLRPWLAPLLRPFPPPSRPASTDPVAIDWEAYEERFSWTRIAREYIAAVQPAGRGER
jgi:glycosyltransferase involved in cell wall biosynthesis